MESVGLHGGECWVTWRVLDYMMGVLGCMVWSGVLGYMVRSVGLHGGGC